MIIELAQSKDKQKIAKLDSHIPLPRLGECIWNGQVYVLKDDSIKNGGQNHRLKDPVVGVLRYSLFWQTIPFLDLLYIDEAYRNRGFGTQMMREWESYMETLGYKYVMTSTQADEDAWKFYEKLGYHKVGGFFPPEQEAEEWMYMKELSNKMKNYETEARERWGDTDAYREYKKKTKSYIEEKWDAVNVDMKAIFDEFFACKSSGKTADSAEAQALVAKLHAHITENYYTCTYDILAGLGKMYISDFRFMKNIDKSGEGTTKFVSDAIAAYTKNI